MAERIRIKITTTSTEKIPTVEHSCVELSLGPPQPVHSTHHTLFETLGSSPSSLIIAHYNTIETHA